jgi:hypothetical protein
VEEEKQLGRCTAEQKKKYRLYLHRGKVALVAMCLWRVLVAGPIFAAVLAHVSTVVTAPAPAA